MTRIALALMCLLMSVTLNAQNAFHPYIHNYELPLEYKYQKINSIASLSDQTMVFATQKGLLSYDGAEWQMLTVPEQPQVLHYDAYSGTLFAGCEKTMGVVEKKIDGKIVFRSLEDSTSDHPVLSIQSVGQFVYYLRASEVVCWNSTAGRIERKWRSANSRYESLFAFKDKVYVTVYRKGIYELQDSGIKSVFTGMFGAVVYSYLNGADIVLGDNQGNVLSFDGTVMTRSQLPAKSFIVSSRVSTGIQCGSEYCAVGTKNAGVAFVNTATGKIDRTANYQTGLSDDEISCLYMDANNGLWIGHSEGISRADMRLNITDFTVFPGLEGTVQTSLVAGNTLYVGTSDGVFYLNAVTSFADISPYIKDGAVPAGPRSVLTMRKVSKIVRVSFQNKSGNGSITKDIPVEIDVPVDSVISHSSNKFASDTIRKQYGIQSFPLHFKRVQGINAKCLHLCPAGNKILVGTNNGLYEIEDNSASKLMEQVAVSYIQPSSDSTFFALSNAGLLSFATSPLFEIISMNEKYIGATSLDFKDNVLWVTSANKLQKIAVAQGRYLSTEKSFVLTEYFPEDNTVAIINGMPTLFTYSDAYIFNPDKSAFEASNPLQEYVSIVQRPLGKQHSFFWVKGSDQWVNLKSSQPTPKQAILFNIFDHISDIHTDVKNNYWVVGDSRLYKIYGDLPMNDSTKGVSINSIMSRTPFTFEGNVLDIDSKNQGLEIRYSSKSYVAESKSLYRFRLLGLNDDWSEWTKVTTIKYPYIPGGSYIFELQTKNVFGQISTAVPLTVNVRVPIWERWWFYLSAGLLIIGGLVFTFSGKTSAAGVQES